LPSTVKPGCYVVCRHDSCLTDKSHLCQFCGHLCLACDRARFNNMTEWLTETQRREKAGLGALV
jgi:hypothetical protein